jgi:hypothetical protein
MNNSSTHAVEFTPETVKEQVGRLQELVYEYIKRLSKLRRDQEDFLNRLSLPNTEN